MVHVRSALIQGFKNIVLLCGCLYFSETAAAQDHFYGSDTLLPLIVAGSEASCSVRLPGGISVFSCNSNTNYTAANHLGTVYTITDSRNNAMAACSYDPYGKANSIELPPYDKQCLYAGTYRPDRNTGLYNTPTRLYTPFSKRFLSTDPQGQVPAVYSYTAGNPISYKDVEGSIIRIAWEDFPATGGPASTPRFWEYTLPALRSRPLPVQAPSFVKEVSAILDQFLATGTTHIYFPGQANSVDVISRLAGDPLHKFFIRFGITNRAQGTTNPLLHMVEYNGTAIYFKKNRLLPEGPGNMGKHSPALGLFHELLHVYNMAFDREAFIARNKTLNAVWDNEEEAYVTRLTNQAAVKLGEDVRQDHSGSSYESIGPWSAQTEAEEANAAAFSHWQPMLD